MAFTPNKNLEQPPRGSDVGTWDTPVNANMGVIDNSFGGTATIALTNSPVTLSPSQYQCMFINFTGTITANILISFPFVGSCYTVENQTVGNFTVTLATTVAGSQVICAPPGEVTDIKTDGNTGHVKFRNLGRIGTYEDFAIATGVVPSWITGCTIPPYLYCNGAVFSSAAYPILTGMLGGTTLPDHRGRFRFMGNDGTARITTAQGGIDGNTLLASGGLATVTLSSANMPNYNLDVNDPTHVHPQQGNTLLLTGPTAVRGDLSNFTVNAGGTTQPAATGITVNSAGGGQAFPTVPPAFCAAIALIRAG